MSNATQSLLSNRLQLSVSRETAERLDTYAALLIKWNKSINLVSPKTIEDLWERHILDSAQLATLEPDAKRWADLGSGAGLPGVIVAAIQADQAQDFSISMVESDRRKCLFMTTALREMGLTANVLTKRIESDPIEKYDVVSARALAPLSELLTYAEKYSAEGSHCLFLKGRNADAELTEARRDWHIDLDRIPSKTDTGAVVLRIKEFSRVSHI